MQEPPIRHHQRQAIDFIANRLGLRNEPCMQDWEFEVVEPEDLDQYLALFDEMAGQDDIRFTLVDMIIQAFESSDHDLSTNAEWHRFLTELRANISIHKWQVWYWACWDTSLDEAWNVAPIMRQLYREVSEQG